jgi:hypothetical protein
MRPVIYYGNLLLSGTLSGTNASPTNPVRQTADGSINLPYIHTANVSPTLQSGSVYVTLTSAQAPVGLSLPRALLSSGHTLKLQSMSNAQTEAGLTTALTVTFSGTTRSYLAETSGLTPALVWRVLISGVSGIVPAQANEIQLIGTRFQLGAPQVGVARGHVRQYVRTGVPGGQPFVRRDGPKLERSQYVLASVVSGELDSVNDDILTDGDGLVAFIDATDGGGAFTLTDDLSRSYWAELLDVEVAENDVAGVSSWSLTFQEIAVD